MIRLPDARRLRRAFCYRRLRARLSWPGVYFAVIPRELVGARRGTSALQPTFGACRPPLPAPDSIPQAFGGRAKAREFLKSYPKATYRTEVESWRELSGDAIEFTMRRLPSAD